MRLAASALALLAVERSAHADVHVGARAEAGAEYDSNPRRLEEVRGAPLSAPIEASPAARFVVSADLVAPTGSAAVFTATGGAGAKRFTDAGARPEDVVIGHLTANETIFLGGATSLALGGAYYDVFQRRGREARDFRSLAPSLRLERAFGAATAIGIGGGYRFFAYKPDRSYDFSGPSAFASVRQLFAADPLAGGADWEWGVNVGVEDRRFSGPRCATAECEKGNGARLDRFWMGSAEVTRTGAFLLGVGVGAHVNASNSYGEALTRGLAHLRFATLLPGALSLSLRAELVALRYADPIPVGPPPIAAMPFVSIEDESRSTIRAEIARAVGAIDLGLRYTFHTNELRSGPVDYERQTVLVFVAFAVER